MYDIKALYEASSVNEAIDLMRQHPDAKIIAGGSDVLIKLREGKLAGCELVSIYGIDALRGIGMDEDGTLRILPLTSFSHITKDPLINEHIKVLGEAVDMVGGPQIRNIGTIGGNISNGVTSADSASTLHAWDAIVELTSAEGVRQLPIKEYYISAGKVALRPAELLTAILIKKESYAGYKGHYIKYAMRNAMDIATLGCSVNVKLSDDKKLYSAPALHTAWPAPCPCAYLPRRKPCAASPFAAKPLMRLPAPQCRTLTRATAGAQAANSGCIWRTSLQSARSRNRYALAGVNYNGTDKACKMHNKRRIHGNNG